MLPDAFNNFANPCLPEGWLSYGAFGGVFCMIASLLIQLIEFAAISNAASIHQQKTEAETKSVVENYKATDTATERIAFDQKNPHSHELAGEHAHEIGHFHTAGMLEEGQSFRNIGTLTLELGIVMHSVIIGITLANTGSEEFTTLLIALVFHQVRIRLNALFNLIITWVS
jgi:ZIP Zinc transporter